MMRKHGSFFRGRRLFGCAPVVAIASLALAAPAGAAVVNDDTAGPGPAGADCANPDHSTIQAAIAAAPAGATIQVCAGTYTGGALIDKPLSLVGAQAGVDARDRTAQLGDETVITTAGFNVDANDVNLDGFRFENVGQGSPAFGPALLLGPNTGDNRVVNSIFRGNVFGMYLTNEAEGDTVVRHNLYDSNNDVGPGGGNGIYGDLGVRGARVDENRFTGNRNSAMVLTETTGRNSDVRFTGNEIVQNRGVTVLLTDDILIADNTIANTDTGGLGALSGITLAGAVVGAEIRNNTVSESSSAVRIVNLFDPAANRNVVVSGNNLLANDYGVRIGDGGYSGQLDARFNRIVGNGTAGIANEDSGETVDAANSWWGCNAGFSDAACDGIAGEGETDASPWLVLSASANPSTVYADNGQSKVSASLTRNSAGQVAGAGFPDNVEIAFAASPLGSVGPSSDLTDAGRAETLFSAGAATGLANVAATLDGETALAPIQIVQAPLGPAGPVGPQGEQGPQGPAGNDDGNAKKKKKKSCKRFKKKKKRKRCLKKKKG